LWKTEVVCSDVDQALERQVVWERVKRKKAKKIQTTPDAGGKSVSEKSQATCTSKNKRKIVNEKNDSKVLVTTL
jgi:hypothetical protein